MVRCIVLAEYIEVHASYGPSALLPLIRIDTNYHLALFHSVTHHGLAGQPPPRAVRHHLFLCHTLGIQDVVSGHDANATGPAQATGPAVSFRFCVESLGERVVELDPPNEHTLAQVFSGIHFDRRVGFVLFGRVLQPHHNLGQTPEPFHLEHKKVFVSLPERRNRSSDRIHGAIVGQTLRRDREFLFLLRNHVGLLLLLLSPAHQGNGREHVAVIEFGIFRWSPRNQSRNYRDADAVASSTGKLQELDSKTTAVFFLAGKRDNHGVDIVRGIVLGFEPNPALIFGRFLDESCRQAFLNDRERQIVLIEIDGRYSGSLEDLRGDVSGRLSKERRLRQRNNGSYTVAKGDCKPERDQEKVQSLDCYYRFG
mmetsp:Transcript_3953/g.9547  ORF Transcript_3953/g.9547 Transcript_3953/m.9547 type:complete len:368 (+) Transcript_3953:113-1216(+)